eukprot:232798-Pleurochrysis_carterae.AAC.1
MERPALVVRTARLRGDSRALRLCASRQPRSQTRLHGTVACANSGIRASGLKREGRGGGAQCTRASGRIRRVERRVASATHRAEAIGAAVGDGGDLGDAL